MSVTSGFFNAQYNETTSVYDRSYTAEQMGSMFDGLINDGIYEAYGDAFAVEPGTGLSVNVKSGRGWFQETWILNDVPYNVALSDADTSLSRIDAIVIDCDKSVGVRENSIIVVSGTSSSTPVEPILINTATHKQYPLAYVTVAARATVIGETDIRNARGVEGGTNFVTGIVENTEDSTARVASLTAQWKASWDEYSAGMQSEAAEILDDIQAQLEQLEAGSAVEPKKWMFTNVSVTSFHDESSGGGTPTYEDYPWVAQVPLQNVTANDTPELIFDYDVISLGIIAPVCRSYNGGVYVYASDEPENPITISTAIFWRANSVVANG